MPLVEFTQFVLPNGNRKRTWIDRPKPVADKANALQVVGVRLEIEVLTSGMVNMEAMVCLPDRLDDKILSGKLVANGPDVPGKVDELIEDAYDQARLLGLISE